MEYEVKHSGQFKYVEEGKGEPLVLLHGLFGALSNFKDLVSHFKKTYRVIIPLLPLYDLTLIETSVSGLGRYFTKFIEHQKLANFHLLGNSLGGHIGLVYTLKHQDIVRTI